jgi:hypothetical protein
MRADEKNVYRSVRDTFAEGSIDYLGTSQAAQSFFAKLQDKFLFAVTGHQAAEIVLERAYPPRRVCHPQESVCKSLQQCKSRG